MHDRHMRAQTRSLRGMMTVYQPDASERRHPLYLLPLWRPDLETVFFYGSCHFRGDGGLARAPIGDEQTETALRILVLERHGGYAIEADTSAAIERAGRISGADRLERVAADLALVVDGAQYALYSAWVGPKLP